MATTVASLPRSAEVSIDASRVATTWCAKLGAGVTRSTPSSSSYRVPSSGRSSSMSIERRGTGSGMIIV
jgi:hypothetical protein